MKFFLNILVFIQNFLFLFCNINLILKFKYALKSTKGFKNLNF
jgi:hypothetical protein